jgi:hypothetical protein
VYRALCVSLTDNIIFDVLRLVIVIVDFGLLDTSHVMFNLLSWIISPDVEGMNEMISGATVNKVK